MNILVVRRGQSPSADQLVTALRALGHDAQRGYPGDINPAWGVTVGWGNSSYTVNKRAGAYDKYEEALTMAHHGVPCPETRQNPPSAEIRAGLWLGRTPNHRRARDLRRPRTTRREGGITYYTRRLDVVEEYRSHVFRSHKDKDRYLICRSGKKVPVPGQESEAHPWIRSRLSGWNISYDGVILPEDLREAARLALKALELDFGAVDLGRTREGKPVVFEVNTAPSLDNPNTAKIYAERIANLCGMVQQR